MKLQHPSFLLMISCVLVVKVTKALVVPTQTKSNLVALSISCNNNSQQRQLSPLKATPALDREQYGYEEEMPPLRKRDRLKRSLMSVKSSLSATLWPGTKPDSTVDAPLPPGSFGCPFLGSRGMLSGNKHDGPISFIPQASEKAGHPNLFKFYMLGNPFVSVRGARAVNQLSALEFDKIEALSPYFNDSLDDNDAKRDAVSIYGNKSFMFERDSQKHAFVRRLVGRQLQGPALHVRAFPLLQQLAQKAVQRIADAAMNNDNNIYSAETQLDYQESKTNIHPSKILKMEELCQDYSIDIIQTHVLGLNLDSQGVAKVSQAVRTLLSSLLNPILNCNIPWIIKRTASFKARKYMDALIHDRIDYLLEHGPDETVLSSMVFAEDDNADDNYDDDEQQQNQSRQRLTRQELIENSLLVLIVGTESVSSTMTLIMFYMALHPQWYQQLKQEQRDIQRRFGLNELSHAILDKECPILNAIILETMRMHPLISQFPKRAKETIVVDGVQIPRGYTVVNNIRLTHQLDPKTRVPGDLHMDPHHGFHPERWFSDDTRPTDDFMPMGAGPRKCIGDKLAMVQMQLFVATLARTIDSFELVNDYSNSGNNKPVEWYPNTMVKMPSDGTRICNILQLESSSSSSMAPSS